MNSSSKDNTKDVSENDISEFTNNQVFKGGLGLLLSQQNNKNTTQHNTSQHKILQSLSKQDNPSPNIPNSSLYSSGFISFRNKKANIFNPQGLNNSTNNKIEEYIDPEIVTQSILEKLNSMKQPSSPQYSYQKTYNTNKNYTKEQKEIRKLFNNESTKEYEEEFEEKDLKTMNTNSSNDSIKPNLSGGDSHGSGEEPENETNNVFWNFSKFGNANNLEDEEANKKALFGDGTGDDNCKKEKYINTIICTLSLLEKGKAIFVSQDDMIFVLPSLFVPKNLKVGNTYMFIVSEYENYFQKSQNIQEIQRKYVNTN